MLPQCPHSGACRAGQAWPGDAWRLLTRAQTLHYTTEFRRGLFQLTDSDLFLTEAKDGAFERSQPMARTNDARTARLCRPEGQKPRKMVASLQALFAELQLVRHAIAPPTSYRTACTVQLAQYGRKSVGVSTSELTASFGWKARRSAQRSQPMATAVRCCAQDMAVFQQQDASELNRILIDAISKSLTRTAGPRSRRAPAARRRLSLPLAPSAPAASARVQAQRRLQASVWSRTYGAASLSSASCAGNAALCGRRSKYDGSRSGAANAPSLTRRRRCAFSLSWTSHWVSRASPRWKRAWPATSRRRCGAGRSDRARQVLRARTQEMTGPNQWRCGGCSKKVDASKGASNASTLLGSMPCA
jgi:hypothetical protein